MRGISVNIIRTPPICRFNPAYAGNILYQISGCLYKKVQPRVCGEYAGGRMITCHFQGSTPRMRGISNCFSDTLSLLRFNPAYAGNIAPLNDMYVQQQVQPRVCGEYAGGRMITCHFQGSTPRMRGISNCFSDTLSLLRFNPAYAGNIAPLNDMYVQQQVQPRVCGEYV